MWWRRSQPAGGAFAALGLLLLAGCGFHPLYGKDAMDPDVVDELANIRIDPLRDRQGQLVRNALLTALSPHGEPQSARYHLSVTWLLTEAQQALQTDNTATRDIENFTITYRLYEGTVPVMAGTFFQVYSFDFLTDRYANIAAQEDIRHRAADAIAGEIRNRLAAYFTKAAEQTRAAAK